MVFVFVWFSYVVPFQERHHTKVQYQLKSERISLAQVFSKMEQVVEVLGIEDYSVSQTTLDNVSAKPKQPRGQWERPSPRRSPFFLFLSCTGVY